MSADPSDGSSARIAIRHPESKRSNMLQDAPPSAQRHAQLKRALRNKRVIVGGTLLFLIIGSVLFAPMLSPYEPNEQALQNRLLPPAMAGGSWDHVLGTDHLGRDMLSRIMHGGRISLFVGGAALLTSGTIGVTMGLLGGYFGGKVDTLLMRTADIQLAFPQLLLVILILVLFGQSLAAIVLVLALADWVIYARLLRGRVLTEKHQEYVDAARAIGAGHQRVIFRHVLPNLVPLIMVVSALQFGVMILLESSLSFLGVGVQPPTSSWGRMLNDGQTYMSIAWWVSTLPGLAIVLTILGTNFLADGLRETLGIE